MTREEQTASFTIALLQDNANEAQNTEEYEADHDRAVSTCGQEAGSDVGARPSAAKGGVGWDLL